MRRRLLGGVVLVSLALCLSALAPCVRSFIALDELRCVRPVESGGTTGFAQWHVVQNWGEVQVHVYRFTVSPREEKETARLRQTYEQGRTSPVWRSTLAHPSRLERHGFFAFSQRYPGGASPIRTDVVLVCVPHWALLL